MKKITTLKLMMMGGMLLSSLFNQTGGELHAQAPNTWTQKANFGGTVRDGAFGFAIGTKGYIGGGNNNGNFKNDVWEYNPATDVWTQKAGVPANEYLASSFVIGTKGYVACGYNTGNAVYEFDPVANTWTAKASMPGTVRYITMGFSVGSKGYCGTGNNPVSPYNTFNDFYEFDPIANTWTAKANMPGPGRAYAVGFGIGSKGYAGIGNVAANAANDFYEYDPAGNTWTSKANVGPVGRLQSFGIALNGKGYIGGGGNNGAYGDPNGFYEYDVTANTWTAKASVPFSMAGPVGFAIGAKLYAGTGYASDYTNVFYEWNSCGPVLNVSPTSAFLCGSGPVALTASGATTYTWSHGLANGALVTPSVTTHYTVTGALSGTCTSTNSAVVTVVVSTTAVNQTVTPATTTFACNGNANINLTTEAGVNYYLRNDANNSVIAGPYAGTGSTLNIPTGNYSTTTTFNINAKKRSGGLIFDGVDDYITTTAGTTFNFAGDFALETWMRSPTGANPGTQVIIGMPGNADCWLGVVNGGYPTFTSGGSSLTGTTVINDGKWHHLAAVKQAGVKYLYVDGVLAISAANTGTVNVSNDLEIGGYNGSYNFNGSIDEVRIFNVALTQAQVATSMTACATGSEAGLILYYNFEDGTGSTIADDIAGLDNNGTLKNMSIGTAWGFGVENCIACAATQLTTKPVVTINSITNQSLTAVNPNICVSGTGSVTIPGSNINIDYFLRDNANNAIVSGPVAGTGSGLTFTTGLISASKTYNVYTASQSAYLDFDGVDDYISATSTVGIPSGNSPYTIEALIRPNFSNSNNNSGTFVFWGNTSSNDAVGFRLGGNGQLDSYWWGNDLYANAGNLADGAWHHVAATYDGTTRSIFVDGVLVGSDMPGTRNTTTINNLTIGAYFSSGTPNSLYAGSMDEVRIWNVARAQSDIQANMSGSLLGNETGLQVYYKFTDGTNSATSKDFAGNDNPGTLTNMATATAWKYYSAPCSLQMTGTSGFTINALPTVAVTNATICSGNSATLVPSGAATYTITGGTFTVTPATTASYSVTGTSSVGCISSNTAVASVSVNVTPTITVNSPTICSGVSVAIVASGPSSVSAYAITGGTFVVTPSVTTSYSVTGTATNNCVSNAVVSTVSVNTTPTISATGATICSNNSVTIGRSGASTYSITGGNFTVTPLTTTSYSVTGTATNGCVGNNTAVVTVSVNATPTLAVNNATICSGNSVAIVPTGAGSYSITGSSFTVTPNNTTSYSVTGTGTNNCAAGNTVVSTIMVNITPTITVNSATICSGTSAVITPTGAFFYTITGNNYTVTPNTTTSYSVSGMGFNGCPSASPAVSTVSVNATPTLAVNSATICSGNSVTIVPTGAGTYSITGNTFSVSPNTTTSYSVTGTGTNNCAAGNTIVSTVSVNTTPTITVNSATICSGASVVIAPAAPGVNSFTITGNNYTVTPNATASYSVSGTGTNGCVSGNAVSTVSVNATPTLAVNNPTICSGNSVAIVPTGAGTYTITGGNYTVTPNTTTSYSVTGTGTNNCVAGNTIVSTVSVNATPTITANSATICSGNSVTISRGGGSTYTITGGTFTVTPNATTAYSVTGTSSAGCVGNNTVAITVSVNVTPTLTVNSATICSGNSVAITPTGAATYSITGNNFTVTPLATSSYSVRGTGANGCVSGNTIVSTVSVNITPTIAANNATICSGNSVAIVPSGAGTYTISGGTFTVSPNATTSYSVRGTSAAGCAGSNTAMVIVSVNATPTISVNNATICSGSSVAIVPSGADTYTISGNSYTVNPSADASYSVTGTSTSGCISSNTAVAMISVNANPTVTVTGGAICAGNSITLMPAGATTYTISGNTFTVSPSGNTSYTVSGTDLNGCLSADAITEVTVNALPNVVATAGAATVCVNSTASLSVSGAVTYSWNSGQTDATIAITPSATITYTVLGTDANGCVNSAMVTQVTDACTGITKQSISSLIFSVYPNPNNGQFVVEAAADVEIAVMNSLGQIVHSEKASSEKTTVSIEHLAKGIYFVEVTSGGNKQIAKIVKD